MVEWGECDAIFCESGAFCQDVSSRWSTSPHGHAVGSWGWNLALYSPIGAWFSIALVALAHRVIE